MSNTRARLAGVAALLIMAGAASAETVQIPGTTVSLEPPTGFTLSQSFPGFHRAADTSSIVVIEFPQEAYEETARDFRNPAVTDPYFAKDNVILTRHSEVARGNASVPLLEGSQKVVDPQGVQLQIGKYITVIGGEKTIMISFNIIDRDRFTREDVVKVVQSVKVLPAPAVSGI